MRCYGNVFVFALAGIPELTNNRNPMLLCYFTIHRHELTQRFVHFLLLRRRKKKRRKFRQRKAFDGDKWMKWRAYAFGADECRSWIIECIPMNRCERKWRMTDERLLSSWRMNVSIAAGNVQVVHDGRRCQPCKVDTYYANKCYHEPGVVFRMPSSRKNDSR